MREAALDALERRWASAEREELTVAKPPPRTVLGAYTTARKSKANGPRRERRPYTTLLTSLAPLVASCDCPDYVRGGLGVRKHILVVLSHIHGSACRLAAARKEKAPAAARLEWDPRLPLHGELDRLAGLRFAYVPPRLARWVRQGVIVESARQDPERRRDVLAVASTLEATPAARAVVREELERVERALAAVSRVPSPR